MIKKRELVQKDLWGHRSVNTLSIFGWVVAHRKHSASKWTLEEGFKDALFMIGVAAFFAFVFLAVPVLYAWRCA